MADTQYLDRYLIALMRKVREDKYPSMLQMDMVEEMLPDEAVDVWLEVLFEKIEDAHYPSVDMLRRVQRNVARQLAAA